MTYVRLPRSDEQALRHFQVCLDKYETGTPEYELARKTFAWLCNKVRFKNRVEAESLSII